MSAFTKRERDAYLFIFLFGGQIWHMKPKFKATWKPRIKLNKRWRNKNSIKKFSHHYSYVGHDKYFMIVFEGVQAARQLLSSVMRLAVNHRFSLRNILHLAVSSLEIRNTEKLHPFIIHVSATSGLISSWSSGWLCPSRSAGIFCVVIRPLSYPSIRYLPSFCFHSKLSSSFTSWYTRS